MAKNINAYCKICRVGYHICNSCKDQRTLRPWRSVVDTIEHYKIYYAIHGYSISKDREQAKLELQNCDLSGLENFKPEIKSVIDEIMTESKKNKKNSKRSKENNIEIEIENNITEESNNDVE